MFYGYDPTYILVIIGAILSMIASSFVQSTYSKYSRVQSRTGMTGAQAAQRILQMSGISDVRIEHVSGKLTDHYDPSKRWSAYRTVYMEALLLLQSAWQRMNADMWYSITKDIFL